jgi:hypothetical protein
MGTGHVIPSTLFVSQFDTNAKLVYLAKAWGNETRIWKNHFSSDKMTAAHYYSSKPGEHWTFEYILDDLSETVHTRQEKLHEDELFTRQLLATVNPKEWKLFLGHAGEVLEKTYFIKQTKQHEHVIPVIMAINMTENVARAGANRLWGKPVAWHFENVGRFGEVSGGERIYGTAQGTPESFEYHSLFAYMFDAYNATAVEWASAGMKYISFEDFFQTVKTRIEELNSDHWLMACKNSEEFVALCKEHYPEYAVNFRSEDAFPLVSVTEATHDDCVDESDPKWKNWETVKKNMYTFIDSIRLLYTSSSY